VSHYSAAPRRGYVIAHHLGIGNSHNDTTSVYCGSGYDFQIRYNGTIIACASWDDSYGQHARGCKCNSIGIVWNGCFGGCSSGNITGPSTAQKCSFAYLMAHLGTPTGTDRLRPHRNCYYWQPCAGEGPTGTVCCGTNFTQGSSTNTSWNSAGISLRDQIRTRRNNWVNYGCCTPPCPTPS
jgi:hypothetical protein